MDIKELHKILLQKHCYATYVSDSVNGDYIIVWLTEFHKVNVSSTADLLKVIKHPRFNDYDGCRVTDIQMVHKHKEIYQIAQTILNQ